VRLPRPLLGALAPGAKPGAAARAVVPGPIQGPRPVAWFRGLDRVRGPGPGSGAKTGSAAQGLVPGPPRALVHGWPRQWHRQPRLQRSRRPGGAARRAEPHTPSCRRRSPRGAPRAGRRIAAQAGWFGVQRAAGWFGVQRAAGGPRTQPGEGPARRAERRGLAPRRAPQVPLQRLLRAPAAAHREGLVRGAARARRRQLRRAVGARAGRGLALHHAELQGAQLPGCWGGVRGSACSPQAATQSYDHPKS
jgi:hypothetical protein